MYYVILGAIPLPVTPAAINIKTPSKNETVTLINDGEINIPKARGLREISFEFMLPRHDYPFALYSLGNFTATVFKHAILNWADQCEPFYFIMVRTLQSGVPVDYEFIKCLIEDFDFDEDADAQGDDVMCSITLKEYKDYGNIYTYTEKNQLQNNYKGVQLSKGNRAVATGKSVKVDETASYYERQKIMINDSVNKTTDELLSKNAESLGKINWETDAPWSTDIDTSDIDSNLINSFYVNEWDIDSMTNQFKMSDVKKLISKDPTVFGSLYRDITDTPKSGKPMFDLMKPVEDFSQKASIFKTILGRLF